MIIDNLFTLQENSEYKPGSPYDRGGADAWYHRGPRPHKIVDGQEVTLTDPAEIAQYHQGFQDEGVTGRHQGKQYDESQSGVEEGSSEETLTTNVVKQWEKMHRPDAEQQAAKDAWVAKAAKALTQPKKKMPKKGVAEDVGDQWSVECQGKEYKCNDETHAVNKARSLINYGGESAIIKQNAKPKYKWALGQKMEPLAEGRFDSDHKPVSLGLSFKDLERASHSAGSDYKKFNESVTKNLNLPKWVNTLELYGYYVRHLNEANENKIFKEDQLSDVAKSLFDELASRSLGGIDSARVGDRVALLHLSTLGIPGHKTMAKLDGFLEPKEIVKIHNRGSLQQLEFADGSRYPEKDSGELFHLVQTWNMTKLFPSRETASKAFIFYSLVGKKLSKELDFDISVQQGVTEARPTRHSMPWSVWNTKSPQDQEFLLKQHPNLVITDKPRPVKPQREKINYGEIANKIEQVVGNTFPDGDPLDWLLPYMRRRWGTDHNAMQHLDRAARRVLGARNYYDYLETVWDQVADDELVPNVSHKNNPWRVSEARHVHTTKQDWMGLPNLGDPAKVDVQRDWKKPTTQTHCPGCYSQDIKTYSDGEKECNQCHKTWDVKGVAEGSLNESAIFLNPNTVIVGQEHGRPLTLSPEIMKKVQAIAAKHGAWYEGNGADRVHTKGQIDNYAGSFDDEVAKTASPNDPKWLYVLFANVKENNRVQRVGVDPEDTIFNRLLTTAKDNSFQGIGFTPQALKKFLAMSSEGKYDFVKMSQQPATQENLTRFLKAGEALMWPDNWEQYPNKAGKIAKAATVDARDQYLASRKSGVYVVGSGHLKAVQQITGKQGVAEGRFEEPLTGWHIVSRAHDQVVRGTPSFATQDQAQKYLMNKMFANHQDFKVVHTAGVAEETQGQCPPATQDITLNLKNRQKAIDEYGYGPLNPDLPNDKFWTAKVKEWNLDSAEEAKQSLCGNCAAFDQRAKTLDCIAQGIDRDDPQDAAGTIDAGDLGYCKFLKFKCASRRTCDAWVTGGPLTDHTDNAQSQLEEKWSNKYKRSINCDHPRGFSQRAHCAGRNKNEDSGAGEQRWVLYLNSKPASHYSNKSDAQRDAEAVTQRLQSQGQSVPKIEILPHQRGLLEGQDVDLLEVAQVMTECLQRDTQQALPALQTYMRRRWGLISDPDQCLVQAGELLSEDLRKWFREKWVRFNPQGKIMGPCARGSSQEGKPKCLPQSKAHSLGKRGRASAAARKRREDPNPERRGAARNVATKKKSVAERCWDGYRQVGTKRKGSKQVPNCVPVSEQRCPHCGGAMVDDPVLAEKQDACYHKVRSRYKVWPSAYASGALVQCRKRGAANWGNKSK